MMCAVSTSSASSGWSGVASLLQLAASALADSLSPSKSSVYWPGAKPGTPWLAKNRLASASMVGEALSRTTAMVAPLPVYGLEVMP